ncbi:BQ2448_423 [Microbotryum intermedium]|uniref:BQ2448_423 protein n=1 Tax=Microbotryum intermedium TaxID=269621 RepID=A0A238F2E2_9BASI|nr:BQ2448_423 [Microbotryum intermedium]
MDASEPAPGTNAVESAKKQWQVFQAALDRTTPHTLRRWMSTLVLFLIFFGRILWAQAYYIVCYALGIYLLNLFLAFLQPKVRLKNPADPIKILVLNLLRFVDPAQFDPSVPDIAESDIADGAPGLPTSMSAAQAQSSSLNGNGESGEFRPFIRRLPEFKFWYSATKAIIFSLLATCFPFFDVPVFWPILLVYFCVLFVITMRRQIGHMRKYKSVMVCYDLGYLPWDLGKTSYGNAK